LALDGGEEVAEQRRVGLLLRDGEQPDELGRAPDAGLMVVELVQFDPAGLLAELAQRRGPLVALLAEAPGPLLEHRVMCLVQGVGALDRCSRCALRRCRRRRRAAGSGRPAARGRCRSRPRTRTR
jgi:hypothetical protein